MRYGGVEGVKRRKVSVEGENSAVENSPDEARENHSEQNLSKELEAAGDVSFEARDASFFDLDLLDCTICAEPLASPIYQCQNGHIACVWCLQKTKEVCPSCQLPSGSIRSLVLEKLIDSHRMKCKFAEFGCTTMVKYAEKDIHERICVFEPLNCPFPNCNFRHELYNLFQTHVMQEHPANWRAYDANPRPYAEISIEFLMLPTDKFFIGFGENVCCVVHRQSGGTVEMGQVGSVIGDMCYPTVLKVLSERFASQLSLRYVMKITTEGNVMDRKTFTLEASCRINEREGSLVDGGAVVVPELTSVKILELRFISPPRMRRIFWRG